MPPSAPPPTPPSRPGSPDRAQPTPCTSPPRAGHAAELAPAIDDFHQRSSTEWEWRYAKTGSVVVDVSHTDVTGGTADGWTVTGVNQCTLGHQDLQGPSTGG